MKVLTPALVPLEVNKLFLTGHLYRPKKRPNFNSLLFCTAYPSLTDLVTGSVYRMDDHEATDYEDVTEQFSVAHNSLIKSGE